MGIIGGPGTGGGGLSSFGRDPETGLIQPTTVETRSEEHKFGESPRLVRNFTCRAGSSEAVSTLVANLGLASGASHPSYPDAKLLDLSYDTKYDDGRGSGGDVWTVTVKATYEIVVNAQDPNPLSRPDIWSFQSQGASIAALFYFDSSDQMKPMTNSANDPIKGLQVDEALQKIIIKGNRSTFPSAIAAAVTNCVNSGSYLGFAQDCVKCQGITGEMKFEVVNDETISYWEVTVELLARQTGWNLLIPDAGYNYKENGEKKRCWVWAPNPDPDTNQQITQIKVASADMVALNGSGAMSPNDVPAILTRRIYKRIPFSTFFGSPPS